MDDFTDATDEDVVRVVAGNLRRSILPKSVLSMQPNTPFSIRCPCGASIKVDSLAPSGTIHECSDYSMRLVTVSGGGRQILCDHGTSRKKSKK